MQPSVSAIDANPVVRAWNRLYDDQISKHACDWVILTDVLIVPRGAAWSVLFGKKPQFSPSMDYCGS